MSFDLHRDMYPHISFFMFLGIRKERYPAALKDYSLLFSWFSSILLLKSNNTINRQISSYDVIQNYTSLLQGLSLCKDFIIILNFILFYNNFSLTNFDNGNFNKDLILSLFVTLQYTRNLAQQKIL